MIDQYIRQYGKRLYGLCLTLCADSYEAEDLYQDTWLRAVKSISQYDPTRAFEPWLTKICVNTYRNTLRRIARSPLLHFRTNEEKDALLQSVPAPENPDYSSLYDAIDIFTNHISKTDLLPQLGRRSLFMLTLLMIQAHRNELT